MENKINDKNNLEIFDIEKHKLPYWHELPEIDLYMDQVIVLMEKYLSWCIEPDQNTKIITPSMINNYVKLGIMPAPIKKKYSRVHIAYLIIICNLKSVIPISEIKTLIERRIASSSIEELLNYFSDLFTSTANTVRPALQVVKAKKRFLNKKATCLEDAALYMAIGSNTSKFISKKIIDINNNK